ncbi:MAG: hypothetical protein IPN61_11760 [Bacteroidetes bacterium]|nr:hypothetical protein [Bacteroidota bacterium]
MVKGTWFYSDRYCSGKFTGRLGYVMIANYYPPTQSFDNLNPFCEVQNSDIRLVRTDLDGNIIWEKKFGGSILDIASNLIVTNDSGYCIVGSSRSESGKSEIILLKQIHWAMTIKQFSFVFLVCLISVSAVVK